MARSQGVIGIDLGTDSIKAVALELVKGEEVPRVLGVVAVPTQGMRKGVVLEPSAVALSLQEAVETLKKSTEIRYGTFFIGIGGLGLGFQKSRGLIAVSRADGQVSAEDIKRALATSEANLSRIQNREILHRIPLQFRIDNETTTNDPVGLMGMKLEAESLFITAFVHHIKSVLRALDEARLEPEDLIASPLALSCAVLAKREREVGAMLLDLGAATTSIILFEEGSPFTLEVLPVGSSHITNDIAVGFQINIDEAEKLKLAYGAVSSAVTSTKKDELIYGNYSRKKLADIIEARLDDIFELVQKHLVRADRVGLLPAGVVLVGGGARLAGIEQYTKDYLKLPARVGRSERLGGFSDKVKDPLWATAVGIALMALEKREAASPFLRGRSGSFLRWLRAFLP